MVDPRLTKPAANPGGVEEEANRSGDAPADATIAREASRLAANHA